LPAETPRRVAALKDSPALLQGGKIEIFKRPDGLLDAGLIHLNRNPLVGA
jgi:hypothetical protein